MSVDTVLSLLSKVRKTGKGQWITCCPGHADKSPSLTIKEADDGRVLLHCFSGCGVEQVLGSIGLTFDDLYPPRPLGNNVKGLSRPFPASDVLRMIAFDSFVVSASAATMRQRPLREKEVERLIEASTKINSAMTACGITLGMK